MSRRGYAAQAVGDNSSELTAHLLEAVDLLEEQEQEGKIKENQARTPTEQQSKTNRQEQTSKARSGGQAKTAEPDGHRLADSRRETLTKEDGTQRPNTQMVRTKA